MSDARAVASRQRAQLSQEALTALRLEFPSRRIWQATGSDGNPGALYAATSAKLTDAGYCGSKTAQTVAEETEAELRAALAVQPDVRRTRGE